MVFGNFTCFWHQNVASRIYALLLVIRQQMSPFDPFRGGGAQRGQCPLFYRFFYLRASLRSIFKGAGVFGRPGQNMEDLGVFGTSRSSNELKSVPQPPCQLRLMKRYFWSHKICHLWQKISLFKAIFDLFLQVFALPTTFMRTLNPKWTRNFLIHMARWVEVI